MRHVVFAAVGLTACLPAISAAAPQVLVNETYEGPMNLNYYSFTSGGSITPSQTGGNHYLRINTDTGYRHFGTSGFQRTTLGVGESISLGFKLSGSRDSAQWITDLNIGLFDSKGTYANDSSEASRQAARDDSGYVMYLRDDWANSFGSAFGPDYAPAMEPDGAFFVGFADFTDGLFHSYEMILTHQANDRLTVTLKQDGIAFWTASNLMADAGFTFDNIQFNNGARASTLLLDDLTVTYTSAVPEPASLAVLALGAGATLLRRKR